MITTIGTDMENKLQPGVLILLGCLRFEFRLRIDCYKIMFMVCLRILKVSSPQPLRTSYCLLIIYIFL